MTTKSDGGNRTRPSTAIYRIIMVEFERQRLARGLSMAQVDDLAGTNDGHYGHMIYPDSPTGRQARWETVQEVAEALFGKGFEVKILGSISGEPSALALDKGASSNALKNRHWRHSKHFADLGRRGGLARAKNLSTEQIRAIAKKAARARKAKRQGAEHKRANAETRTAT
jgi:hypothetical protein